MSVLNKIAWFQHRRDEVPNQKLAKERKRGWVTTRNTVVRQFALEAAADAGQRREICAYLLNHLRSCRPKDVPQHVEKTVPAISASNKAEFLQILEKRMSDLSKPQ